MALVVVAFSVICVEILKGLSVKSPIRSLKTTTTSKAVSLHEEKSGRQVQSLLKDSRMDFSYWEVLVVTCTRAEAPRAVRLVVVAILDDETIVDLVQGGGFAIKEVVPKRRRLVSRLPVENLRLVMIRVVSICSLTSLTTD